MVYQQYEVLGFISYVLGYYLMSKYDEYVQPEEDSELLIYEEWQNYVEEKNRENEEDWEYWVELGRYTD
jgi:hypothetical protein